METNTEISLNRAFEILNNSTSIILDGIEGTFACTPSLSPIENKDENEFMFIGWEDNGQKFHTRFCEGDNKTVKVYDKFWATLRFQDNEGDFFDITPLFPSSVVDLLEKYYND